MDDNAANDKSKERYWPLEKQGLEKSALDKPDVNDARNAGASDLRTVESQRTNASNGSLQERQRLMAGQDESVEIVGFESSASRHSKLRENDLLKPAARPADSAKSFPQSVSNDDGPERPIFEYRPEQVGPKTFSLGLACQESRTFSQKMADFAIAASGRLLDPEDQKAYAQQQIDKILVIGEGLNIAKESTKLAAVNAWKALTDGSVASFLAKPNAINDPLFKAISGTFDAMAKDPNLVNKVLVTIEHHIVSENDKYVAMAPREKGRFIGEVMFAMFNPESSTEAGEASLKMADRIASGAEKAEGYLGEVSSTLRKSADDSVSTHKSGEVGEAFGSNSYDLEPVGAGGEWPVINERSSLDVVQQIDEGSCASAVGEMLTDGRIQQRDLIARMGSPGYPERMAQLLGEGWKGGYFGPPLLNHLMAKGRSWGAEFKEFGKLGHLVVVDGIDEFGRYMIRDPDKATRYEMLPKDFEEFWTGRAVSYEG
ncbi:hypothetical protein KBI23_27190 [bacterium]|nr:hypothetical protein [bacterium]